MQYITWSFFYLYQLLISYEYLSLRLLRRIVECFKMIEQSPYKLFQFLLKQASKETEDESESKGFIDVLLHSSKIYLAFINAQLFNYQPQKIIKHTQTIGRPLPTNCLILFDHFVGFALKGLTLCLFSYEVKTLWASGLGNYFVFKRFAFKPCCSHWNL